MLLVHWMSLLVHYQQKMTSPASSIKAVLHLLRTDVLNIDTVNDSTLTKEEE